MSRTAVRLVVATSIAAVGFGLAGGTAFAQEDPFQIPGMENSDSSESSNVQPGQPGKGGQGAQAGQPGQPGKVSSGDSTSTDDESQGQSNSQPTTRPSDGGQPIGDS